MGVWLIRNSVAGGADCTLNLFPFRSFAFVVNFCVTCGVVHVDVLDTIDRFELAFYKNLTAAAVHAFNDDVACSHDLSFCSRSRVFLSRGIMPLLFLLREVCTAA